jgi:hypothetical protein
VDGEAVFRERERSERDAGRREGDSTGEGDSAREGDSTGEGDSADLFLGADVHWTPAGHQRIAEALAKVMTSSSPRGLVARPPAQVHPAGR